MNDITADNTATSTTESQSDPQSESQSGPTTTPLFVPPAINVPAAAATTSEDDDPTSVRIDIGMGKPVEIVRMAPAPALHPLLKSHERAFMRAFVEAHSHGLIPHPYPEDAARAFAWALADSPKVAVGRISSGIQSTFSDSADVYAVSGHASCLMLVPGTQPRGAAIGGRVTQVAEPREDLARSAAIGGRRVLEFDDPAHLRAWSADTLSRSLTRAKKVDRPAQIVATGVRRPVQSSLVLVTFRNGTAPQWVHMVSEGITRLTVTLGVLTGNLKVVATQAEREAGLTGDDVAGRNIAAILLAPLQQVNPESKSNHLLRLMAKAHKDMVEDYEATLDVDNDPDEAGLVIRQCLTMPVQVYIEAVDPDTGDRVALEPAMQGIVADIHTGVDGWADADDHRHSVVRALDALVQSEKDRERISVALYQLATGRGPALLSDEISPTQDGVDSRKLLLRRAVTLQSQFVSKVGYEPFKKYLRRTAKIDRVDLRTAVKYLGPLVHEPWGARKGDYPASWGYGGPVLPSQVTFDLKPVHPVDYRTLVETALTSTDEVAALAARCELALAGGTALITEGIVTTEFVGGSGGRKATFEMKKVSQVYMVIEQLTMTRPGLLQLAEAANAFDPLAAPGRARTPRVLPDGSIKKQNTQKPEQATLESVAALALLAGSIETNGGPEVDGDSSSRGSVETPEQRVQRLDAEERSKLRTRAAALIDDTRALAQAAEEIAAAAADLGEASGLSTGDKFAIKQNCDAIVNAVLVLP